MKAILASLSLAFAAVTLWQATHCPMQGGVCHCEQPSYAVLLSAAIFFGALACYPTRKRTVPCN